MSGKASAPSHGASQRKKPATRTAEKIAVNKNLTVEDLLHDFLRQQLAPDPNDGNNYYLGIVLSIQEAKQNDTSIYNIFDDSVINMERFYTNFKSAETETTKRLLVHIPELYSTNEYSKDSVYNRYTKFKINYSGGETIKVNDILKITFKNSSDFTDPEIISIHKSKENENYVLEAEKIRNSLESVNQCRVLQLNNGNLPTADLNSVYLETPFAGYYQLFSELAYVLSPDGFNTFIRQQPVGSDITIDKLSLIKYEIYADSKVKAIVEQPKLQANFKADKDGIPVISDQREDYEVLIRLRLNDKKILTKFASFIDEKLSRFKFFSEITSVKDSEIKKDNTFYLDIIIDVEAISKEDLENISVDKYIEVSNQKKNGSGPSASSANTQSSQNSNQTVQQNSTFDPCENLQPQNTDIYVSINDTTKWTRRLSDSSFVNYALGNSNLSVPLKGTNITSPQGFMNYLISEEYLKISGEKVSKKESVSTFYDFQELVKINPKFYSIPQKVIQTDKQKKIGIQSNFKDNRKDNFISEGSLNYRISQISKFLGQLREDIAKKETNDKNKVLIIPLNVLRANRGAGSDQESRHYYGQAVDFVVYVNFSNDLASPSIFQIPPEIVYLYCNKLSEKSNSVSNCGNGIFIKEMYNHFEYLVFPADERASTEVRVGLTEDERKYGRLWVVGGSNDQLKDIEKFKVAEKQKVLLDYISKNYAKLNTANPVLKIKDLLEGLL